MNNVEARAILKEHIARYQTQSCEDLLRLLNEQDTFQTSLIDNEVVLFPQPAGAPDEFVAATVYQVEIQAFWDNKPGEVLHISASIDDGKWRAYFPLTEGFLVWPDGNKG